MGPKMTPRGLPSSPKDPPPRPLAHDDSKRAQDSPPPTTISRACKIASKRPQENWHSIWMGWWGYAKRQELARSGWNCGAIAAAARVAT
eukprot:9489635-Pyramimonas_sp.AAC.1